MINFPMKSVPPMDRQTILTANRTTVQDLNYFQSGRGSSGSNSGSADRFPTAGSSSSAGNSRPQPVPPPQAPQKSVPPLCHPVQKGQKLSLEASGKLTKITAAFGWNTLNPLCDVDVSAFLLNTAGKVIGDDWFVFYGQTQSPDSSTVFSTDASADSELVSIDFTKLNPAVSKIVFVLTINDAFTKQLNFSMLKDAYVRIIDSASSREIVSFQMDEYYSNVCSMMIGEVYLHQGTWKFHAIGSGVARDLAGLCELYGVQVV